MTRVFQHTHDCRTPNCPNFYVCMLRDCPTGDWQCPACDDLELLHDLDLMEQEQSTYGNHRER